MLVSSGAGHVVSPSRRPGLAKVAVTIAFMVVLAVVALAIDLLLGGPPGVERTPGGRYAPYPAAVLPLASVGLILLGLLRRQHLQVAWTGLLFLALWGGVTFRFEGMPFLVVVVILLPELLLVQLFGGAVPAKE